LPSIQSTGGIFLRLDASGNLNIYDTSGTSILKLIAGKLSGTLNKGTAVSNGVITTTSSLSDTLVGANANFTPQISNLVMVGYFMTVSNGTAGDGANANVYLATGTSNPAGGGGPSGSALGSSRTTSATAGAQGDVGLVTFASVTVGQAYTLQLTIAATTGGTVTINNLPGQIPFIVEV
jgi:hypothetical protein